MKIILIFLSFLLLTCKADSHSKEIKIIEKFLQDYYQTMSDRNWEEYKEFFWEEATLCTIWSPDGTSESEVDIFTIQDFLDKTEEGPDSQPIFEEKMEQCDVVVKGNLATAWVRYTAKFGTQENLMEWSGTDLFSFMQFKNRWKIVNLSYAAE